MTVRAHFDGKVIVPDEPVNLPANAVLEVEIKQPVTNRKREFKHRNGIPLARNDGVRMTSEEIAAAINEG